LQYINNSGVCLSESSSGTITIQGLDSITITWGTNNGATASEALWINCGQGFGNYTVSSTYSYEWYGQTTGSFQTEEPMCLWDGA
jgi:hypothetical protein